MGGERENSISSAVTHDTGFVQRRLSLPLPSLFACGILPKCGSVEYGPALCYCLSRGVHGLRILGERRWQGDAGWLPQVTGDAAEESWSQQDRRCGEALPMDGPPLVLLPDCNPISLSSQTPPATLGSCPLPALLVSSSLLGKCPLGESDSRQTTVIQNISTQITMLLICPKIHSKKKKEVKHV